MNKRLRVQGEYMLANYTFNENAKDYLVDETASNYGAYIYASYFLTDDGYAYDYKDAEFARLIPRSSKGAWEVAARFSKVDLNDDSLKDGDDLVSMWGASQSYTLGVNYYPNANIHMMLNYGIVDNDEYATGRGTYQGDYDFQYVSMRFLTAF